MFFFKNDEFGSKGGKGTELLYLWIDKTKYSCFDNNEFNFSPNYIFHFDGNTVAGKKIDYPNVYENTNITNITAIVGANGVGKTTLLDFISFFSGRESKTYSIDNGNGYYIAIYKQLDQLIIFNYTEKTIFCEGDLSYSYREVRSKLEQSGNDIFKDTTVVYLSLDEKNTSSFSRREGNTFVPLTPKQVQNDSKVFFRNKITNSFLALLKNNNFDLESFVIVDYLINEPSKQYASNVIRISLETTWNILTLDQREKILKKTPVEGFFQNGTQNVRVKNYVREKGLAGLFIVNLAYELMMFFWDKKEYMEGLNSLEWETIDEYLVKVEEIINNLVGDDNATYFKQAIKEIKIIQSLNEYIVDKSDLNLKKETDRPYFNIELYKFKPLLNCIFKSQYSFVFKYITFELNKSEGELTRIKHQAYLYYLANRNSFIADYSFVLKNNIIMLMDEIDVHMHPEWQRLLVNDLIFNIKSLFKGKDVQIILTTHSPIVLSDIPGNNVIYISKDNKNNRIVEKRSLKTFGANIHNLYSDSFFYNSKLPIGEYAKGYINSLHKMLIENNEDNYELLQKARQVIDIIGEPIFRNVLLEKTNIDIPKDNNNIKTDNRLINEIKDNIKSLERLLLSLEGNQDD